MNRPLCIDRGIIHVLCFYMEIIPHIRNQLIMNISGQILYRNDIHEKPSQH